MTKRVYDQSAINTKGTQEDTTRCIASVSTCNGWHFPQCSRKRGHGREGLFCKQHAKIYKDRKCLNED